MEESKSQIVIYKDQNNNVKIDVRFDGDTVWLSQINLAGLFQTTKQNISLHIKNIFEERELQPMAVVKEYLTTASDGKKYKTYYYNLELIIALGYRIKSKEATQFRIWATDKLKSYIVKGFVLDDERLKNPDLPFDYFEELERKISDIRTSEKRFYRKITDIYATSVDYDPTSEESILFFKTVQNKVHYAIIGNTAAEIVVNRIDTNKENLGLTNFRGAKPSKEEILIAKNYLNIHELEALNNLVEQYLVFAIGQARQRIPMTMKDWIEKLHGFLTLNNRKILEGAGKISHELMEEIANKKFKEYKKIEDRKDVDFDKEILKILPKGKVRKINKKKK